jgi:hypothetical protein
VAAVHTVNTDSGGKMDVRRTIGDVIRMMHKDHDECGKAESNMQARGVVQISPSLRFDRNESVFCYAHSANFVMV